MCSPAFSRPPRGHDRRRRNAVRSLMTPLLVPALTACGGDSGPAPDMVVEDSAGVRIVQHTGTPDAGPPFVFAPEPLYRHGNDPDDHMFAGIWNGILLSDGSAAIFDAGSSELVLLNPDGTFNSVLAPPGEGPGEVGMVTAMFEVGRDSILVEDIANGRFTLFVNGAVARTVSTRGPISEGLSTHGMDASGGMLMSSSSYRRGFPDEWLPGYMVRFDLDTGVADTVASFDWIPFRQPDGTPENPFSHVGIVGAVGGEFLYGRTDTPELIWQRPDGSIRQIVRWEADLVYPTEEHWDIFAADLRETAPSYNPHAQTEEAIEELITSMLAGYRLEPDEPLPLFTLPIADDTGRVWLGKFTVASDRGSAPSYTVFSPEGQWLGRLDVPDGMRVLAVAGDRVLGVVKDEMDVESVVVYELVDSG